MMTFRIVRARTALVASTLAIALTLTFGAVRAYPKVARNFEPIKMVVGLIEKLNLSTDQRAQLRAVISAHRANLTNFTVSEREARASLFASIHAESVQETQIRTASATVAAIDADFAVERARTFADAAAVLTPEQRAIIENFVSEMQPHIVGQIQDIGGAEAGLSRLRLDDAQKNQIEAILRAHQAELDRAVSATVTTHRALGETIRQPVFNEAAVREAAKPAAAAAADLAVLRAEVAHEIYAVLTPEQQAKLDAVRAKLQNRMADRVQSALNVGLRLL